MILWPLFVYYPLAHWIRADGWLSSAVDVIDVAGGLTLHTTAGMIFLKESCSPSFFSYVEMSTF